MKFTQECPICGSTEISGPHYLSGRFGPSIPLIALPNGRTSMLKSLTCSKCGYSQLYADEKGLKNIKNAGRTYEMPDMGNEYCPNCGASFEHGLRRCSKCGLIDVPEEIPIEPKPFPCENCGLSLEYGSHTCPACGYRSPES